LENLTPGLILEEETFVSAVSWVQYHQ